MLCCGIFLDIYNKTNIDKNYLTFAFRKFVNIEFSWKIPEPDDSQICVVFKMGVDEKMCQVFLLADAERRLCFSETTAAQYNLRPGDAKMALVICDRVSGAETSNAFCVRHRLTRNASIVL